MLDNLPAVAAARLHPVVLLNNNNIIQYSFFFLAIMKTVNYYVFVFVSCKYIKPLHYCILIK